ncbi:DinB family protein [Deinococcus taeanensis]|uniref:DinB family protein n=1 Tax=Deinococcus taeanensis TaxID=2737050 RepID=UPI001CDB9732|nr:DinB family protein [Deinococcus taeanensis]UBV42671.1 DinB family protein [Deinococcus taeanensis]
MPDLTLLLGAIERNARVNDSLLETLVPDDLTFTDGRGGWSLARHLSHMAAFRGGWLLNIAPDYARGLPERTGGRHLWEWVAADTAALRDMFRAGDDAAVRAVQAHRASGEPFADPWKEGAYQSDPAQFLVHIIVHDSHHRGQVMSLLRQGGRSPEAMERLDDHWAIWRA